MDIVVDLGTSFINSLLITATKTVGTYFKDKKEDEKYVKIIKKIEDNKKEFENNLISYAESKISKSNFINDEILSKFDSNLIISTAKQIFEKMNKELKIKNEINELIKNYKFSENLQHFNILILGRAGIGKSTLINSILEIEGTPEAAQTGIGKAVTYGEPKGYTSEKKKGLRLWDSQGIDKEKNDIANVVRTVEKMINEASINNNPDKFIHCIWYCVSGQRFEESERESLIELMKIYDDDSLPIIVVYTEAYSGDDVKAVSDEIREILKEKINKIKEINICQVVAKDKELKFGKKSFVIEKFGITKLLDISLQKIIKAVNSACFFSFKNKLKTDNESEINKKKSDLIKIIEKRTNDFQTGNKISNIELLNRQIYNKVINYLLGPEKANKDINNLMTNLFKKYQSFIIEESNNQFPLFLGNSTSELFMLYKNDNKEKGNEEQNEDEINIAKELNKNMNFFLDMKNTDKNKKKKDRSGVEDELIKKVSDSFRDCVLKKASVFIDEKIAEEISKLIIESFNRQINDFNEVIENIVTECMNKQSSKIMENFK
jgi:hypothetical protein